MPAISKINFTLRSYQNTSRVTQKVSFFSIWQSSPWIASKVFVNSVYGGSKGRDKIKKDFLTVQRFFKKRKIFSEEGLRSWFGVAEGVQQVGKIYSE